MKSEPAISASFEAERSMGFNDLARIIIERRMLILACTLVGVGLGIAWAVVAGPLYRAQAILNLGYVSFAEYKRYSAALLDREKFLDYVSRNGQLGEREITRVRNTIAGPDGLYKWIHPVFAITKTDVRDVAETPKDANQFTGVEIDIAENSKNLVQKLAFVTGTYVRDFVLEGKITDFVLPNLMNVSAELTRKEIDILRSEFDRNRLSQRKAALKIIANRYPGADKLSTRQVISTQEGGERYLAPETQMIGIEAQILEADSDIAGLQRDRERLSAMIAFFELARSRLANAKTGEHLGVLNQTYEGWKKQQDTGREAIRDAVNSIKLDVDHLRALYADHLHLLNAPAAENQFRSIVVWGPVLLLVIFMLLLALMAAIVADWWRTNRAAVMMPRP